MAADNFFTNEHLHRFEFQCSECGKSYPTAEPRWKCDCGSPLAITGIVSKSPCIPDPSEQGMWRYKEVLPLLSSPISIGEIMTPVVPVELDGRVFHMKLDFLSPTGSYKDRGVSLLVTALKAWGIERAVEDSSGNAGSSMAAYCGKAGIDCNIYVPSNTSLGKTAQISVYGANLIKIQGSREDTALAAMEAGRSMFYASHNWSPFFEHGVKTYVYEMWEQLGHELPDVIIVPCGNGSLVTSAYLAIEELVGQGRAAKRPRLVGVQSEKCDPLARAWEQGLDSAVQVQKGTTIAEGIASALPVKSKQILEAVRKSSGLFVTVSDKDIIHALKTLASQGIFIEPTSATAPAAAIKLHEQGLFGEKEMVTVELTGTGLKAMDKVCNF